MKNKFLTFAILIFSCFFAVSTAVKAQHSSVSFNKKGISVVFKVETSSPEATKQSFGSVYFTGYDETEKESRVHRVFADRESGAYFGYDLVIESGSEPNKFKVSFRPLSMTPPETLRLSDLTMRSLPKYPEDMTVEDGDTISLDLLYNPQTKVKITDLIKITTKKPQSSDSSLFTTTAKGSGTSARSSVGAGHGVVSGSGTGSGGGLFAKQNGRDFTLGDVKLRLTSPKLLIDGAVGTFRGSEWEGIIEGSVIFIYVPGKGRFIFSLFPQNGSNFQKKAFIEDNRIVFQLNDERYELVSAAPIVSGSGGNWNLWAMHDTSYRPDLIFSAEAAGYVEYGASNEVENLLKQDWRKSRLHLVRSPEDKAGIYAKWINEDVRYIISETEKQAFSRLNTDEEREQFIEAFWRRRDPKPETEENEFRREYYGRIAYANQNFGFGKTAGWLTDRGQVYIIHGKPDEAQKNGAEEIWIYKSLPELGGNVRFEFVDATNNGDFRLRK